MFFLGGISLLHESFLESKQEIVEPLVTGTSLVGTAGGVCVLLRLLVRGLRGGGLRANTARSTCNALSLTQGDAYESLVLSHMVSITIDLQIDV